MKIQVLFCTVIFALLSACGGGGSGGGSSSSSNATSSSSSSSSSSSGGNVQVAPTPGSQRLIPANQTSAPFGYAEYTPAAYTATGNKWPVIIAIDSPADTSGDPQTDVNQLEQLGTGMAYQISKGQWDPQKRFVVLTARMTDMAAVSKLNNFIQFAVSNYNVDPKRIYLTGYKNAWYAMTELLQGYSLQAKVSSPAAAAIISQNGDYGSNWSSDLLCMFGNIPTYYFANNGDTSGSAAISTRFSGILQDCRTKYGVSWYDNHTIPSPGSQLTIFNATGSDAWSGVYSLSTFGQSNYTINVYDWFLSFQRDYFTPIKPY